MYLIKMILYIYIYKRLLDDENIRAFGDTAVYSMRLMLLKLCSFYKILLLFFSTVCAD